jgi:hypothetical protein
VLGRAALAVAVLGQAPQAGLLQAGEGEMRPLLRFGKDQPDAAAFGSSKVGVGVCNRRPCSRYAHDVRRSGAGPNSPGGGDRPDLSHIAPQRNAGRLGDPAQKRPGERHFVRVQAQPRNRRTGRSAGETAQSVVFGLLTAISQPVRHAAHASLAPVR